MLTLDIHDYGIDPAGPIRSIEDMRVGDYVLCVTPLSRYAKRWYKIHLVDWYPGCRYWSVTIVAGQYVIRDYSIYRYAKAHDFLRLSKFERKSASWNF